MLDNTELTSSDLGRPMIGKLSKHRYVYTALNLITSMSEYLILGSIDETVVSL